MRLWPHRYYLKARLFLSSGAAPPHMLFHPPPPVLSRLWRTRTFVALATYPSSSRRTGAAIRICAVPSAPHLSPIHVPAPASTSFPPYLPLQDLPPDLSGATTLAHSQAIILHYWSAGHCAMEEIDGPLGAESTAHLSHTDAGLFFLGLRQDSDSSVLHRWSQELP